MINIANHNKQVHLYEKVEKFCSVLAKFVNQKLHRQTKCGHHVVGHVGFPNLPGYRSAPCYRSHGGWRRLERCTTLQPQPDILGCSTCILKLQGPYIWWRFFDDKIKYLVYIDNVLFVTKKVLVPILTWAQSHRRCCCQPSSFASRNFASDLRWFGHYKNVQYFCNTGPKIRFLPIESL